MINPEDRRPDPELRKLTPEDVVLGFLIFGGLILLIFGTMYWTYHSGTIHR
ncbi:MAG TPA: hypothetical protein VG820_04300 [Fimbriimonadaceae bacterium]|nr:hypothetical protein [Fimbriimonadaceae bacterium]